MTDVPPDPDQLPRMSDELDVLASRVPLAGLAVVEAGCGNARLVRALLARHPDCQVTALETDAVQHAKNLARPQPGLTFLAAGAQAMPLADAAFDLALMLKSLHHVPLDAMDAALAEVARVLRPGGWFYVSEPIYGGALNEVVRLFNDEGLVRPAAQAALDRALAQTPWWTHEADIRFAQPVHFRDFEAFEQRMLYPSFADHHVDAALVERVRAAFRPHLGADGAHFARPMHVRLMRRTAVVWR
jgi:SAM-dependent methyltransferase